MKNEITICNDYSKINCLVIRKTVTYVTVLIRIYFYLWVFKYSNQR